MIATRAKKSAMATLINMKKKFNFFYLTRPLLLGDFRKSSPVPFFTLKEGAPPLPRPPLLRRGLQPVNRMFCTRKQALAPKGVARGILRNRVASVLTQ